MILANLFEEIKDKRHFLLVVEESTKNAEKMDPDSKKRNLFLLRAKKESMKYADRKKAAELFDEVYNGREVDPLSYSEAIFVYGLRFHEDPLIKEELAKRVETGIELIAGLSDRLDADEMCDFAVRFNHILYLISGDETTAKLVIDAADEMFSGERTNPYVFMALRDLLNSESLPKKHKNRIVRIGKKYCFSKEKIIELGDDFQITKGYF